MVNNQTNLFLIFIVNGIIIGLLFDFFRILRKTFKTSDIITYIEDIIFWILTGFIILYSTFTFNNGEIRLFLFLGIILGVILYILFISSYIIKINVSIINYLKKIMKKTFLKPISFVIINIRKFSTNSLKKIYYNIKSISKTKNSIKN